MPARQTIMRVITVGFGLAAGGVYAATAGFLPIPGIGQSGDNSALVLSSASTGGGAGPAGSRAQILAAPQAASPETAGAIADAAAPVPASVPAEVPAPVQLAALDAETGDLAPVAPLPVPPPAEQVQDDPATSPAELTDEDVALSPLGLPCGMTLVATPGPAATVAIDILTPCRPELRVQIEHSGMTFAAMTDALGVLTVDMPAFESPAFVTVRLADGETASELVTIPDLAQYERVGLAWDGDRALELHAMEDGAAFGGPGHVWQDAAGSADMAETGAGGFLTLLGDADAPDPMLAQVYTLPRSFLDGGRRVDLSIDAPVTEANCGLPTDAVTLRMQDAQGVDVTDLSFNTPGCDAVGDILVLQNLLGPLRLAAN